MGLLAAGLGAAGVLTATALAVASTCCSLESGSNPMSDRFRPECCGSGEAAAGLIALLLQRAHLVTTSDLTLAVDDIPMAGYVDRRQESAAKPNYRRCVGRPPAEDDRRAEE